MKKSSDCLLLDPLKQMNKGPECYGAPGDSTVYQAVGIGAGMMENT